jgi:polyhydroxyalkanoate synthesis regulator phasin
MKKHLLTKEEHQAYVAEMVEFLRSRRGAAWDERARDQYKEILERHGILDFKPMPAD